MRRENLILLIALAALLTFPASAAIAQEGEATHESQEGEAEEHEAAELRNGFWLGRQASWLFRSFLNDKGDDASTLGLEFESYLGFGDYQIKNISYFEINKFPRAIPGQPVGNPEPGVEAADGIGDVLSAFWLSKRGGHHGKHHFSPGFAMQLPTAADDSLGSGKWAIGPSFDYEYESGRIFAGAIALQLWSFAGDPDRKSVSMLMIKPFFYYTLSDKWDLMYVPYGIQVYWNKKPGEKVYLPLGGGVQRKIPLGSTQMNLGAAVYYNVVRPTKGTVWDLRFLVEFNF